MTPLNHFRAMIIFALLISIATAGLTQRTTRGRIRHAGISFALFVVIGLAIAWLMFPFSK
jgi:hypothetical protein